MRYLILFFFTFSFTLYSQNNKINIIDKFIVDGKEIWKIPGMTVVIVKDDSTFLNKSYGVKNYLKSDLVDSKTIFSMASTTKAFISMSLGILVDRDVLKWNDKVIDHFKDFKLSDPYVSKEARVKDLLTHNLGIGNEDELWTTDSTSVEEMLDKFSLSKLKYSLRGGYVYQNIMYVIAGKLIEEVSGLTWQKFVDENIINKIGLSCTLTWSKDIFEYANYTYPHMNDFEDGILHVPFTISDQIGAAGMMWSCADDMEKYLKFLLNKTLVNGELLLSNKTFEYIFEPQIIIGDSFYPTQRLTNPNWKTYGLGWFQHDYRGQKVDLHTGSLQGLVAIIALIRDKNIGVHVFSNLDNAELRHAIIYKVFDLLVFDDDTRDWNNEIFKLYREYRDESIDSYLNKFKERVLGTSPSLEIEFYLGRYSHPMYGDIVLTLNKNKLNIDVNRGIKNFETEHWNFDTFITDKDEKWRQKLLVDFKVGDNIVESLKMYDVVFKKNK